MESSVDYSVEGTTSSSAGRGPSGRRLLDFNLNSSAGADGPVMVSDGSIIANCSSQINSIAPPSTNSGAVNRNRPTYGTLRSAMQATINVT